MIKVGGTKEKKPLHELLSGSALNCSLLCVRGVSGQMLVTLKGIILHKLVSIFQCFFKNLICEAFLLHLFSSVKKLLLLICNKDKAHTHIEETTESRTTLRLLVMASNWSGIRLGNCTFLSCWVCLDSETKEDYAASSRRPHLEGLASSEKKEKK